MALRVTRCACGFDCESDNVTDAVAICRAELRKVAVLLVVAICAMGLLAWLVTTDNSLVDAVESDRIRTGVPMLLFVTAIYGVGRGVSLGVRVRRRLRILRKMQVPPRAQVVDRGS
jgi:hypothetical protein